MFQHIVYSLANRQGLFAYVRTWKTRLDTTTKFMVVVTIHYSILLFHHSLTTCSIMHEHGCWFIMMVPTTLFKFVRSSSHEQSVPTCMNKLSCQQHCSTICKLASSTTFKLASSTIFKLARSTMFKPINNTAQPYSS